MKIIQSALVILIVLSLSSCTQRLVGTWNVERYEISKPGESGVKLSNVGTIEFKNRGLGEKTLSYTIFGRNRYDETPFKWVMQDNQYVSIESRNSDLSKIWIIMENTRKYQKWKSTDGVNNVEVLELRR